MEKVKQIDGYSPVSGMIRCINGTGSYINREDHIAALKEIFPDWPGEYPKEKGCYYFGTPEENEPVVVSCTGSIPDCYVTPGGLFGMIIHTNPKEWGPRCTVWRKI